MIFAYFAPEVALPVASALAATFGFFMLMGRSSVRYVMRGCRAAARGVRSLFDKLKF